MKASYFLGKGSFEVRQAPELHPGPGEVVIKNMVCGVCGTDVHIFHGEPGSADVNPLWCWAMSIPAKWWK